MTCRIRLLVGLSVFLAIPSSALAQTPSALPKYNGSGGLVDSAVTETSGNVGIGTNAPTSTLEVKGTGATIFRLQPASASDNVTLTLGAAASSLNRARIYSTGSGGDSSGDLRFAVGLVNGGVNPAMVIRGSGNVGVGTSDPQATLELRGAGATLFRLQPQAAADSVTLTFGAASSTLNRAAIYSTGSTGDTAGDLRFAVGYAQGSPVDPAMVIRGTGNVGIGTTSPSAKLHVAGNVVVDGNIGARYQDVAEWVEADQPISAGTVVIADPLRDNRVRASQTKYDTAVAGVISAQPGVLLGEQSDSKVAVAQSGRVRVKVDASYGAIARGDLLVTSPTPGYAMKSRPVVVGGTSIHRPGTILGKALESLTTGTGEILVLITLQ